MSKKETKQVGSYFVSDKKLEFISSGCMLLDCVLGGGYPLGRVVNIVGDKSTGKTLLAIEAFANFNRNYPNGKMFYHESEAAFDVEYASTLGMPVDKVEFVEGSTVEDLFEILDGLTENESTTPVLYVVDSLDALSDRDELERKIDAGSYSMTKQKKLSEIFRRLTSKLEKTNICLFIISQVRDNIGVMFGDKYTRSGGKALDFYASQILWLSEVEKISKTIRGRKNVIGILIKAKGKKNKVGLPYRECKFPIILAYGIDDITANLTFLSEVKLLPEEIDGLKLVLSNYLEGEFTDKQIKEISSAIKLNKDSSTKLAISNFVKTIWNDIEKDFLPTTKKYE